MFSSLLGLSAGHHTYLVCSARRLKQVSPYLPGRVSAFWRIMLSMLCAAGMQPGFSSICTANACSHCYGRDKPAAVCSLFWFLLALQIHGLGYCCSTVVHLCTQVPSICQHLTQNRAGAACRKAARVRKSPAPYSSDNCLSYAGRDGAVPQLLLLLSCA